MSVGVLTLEIRSIVDHLLSEKNVFGIHPLVLSLTSSSTDVNALSSISPLKT